MFKDFTEKIYPEMAALREDLHRHPELSGQEFRTSQIVMDHLRSYGLDRVEKATGNSIIGLLYGTAEDCGETGQSGSGRCIALRADMDALPVEEESGLPFASEVPGVMHACGHDLHTSVLLAAARILAEHRDQFRGCVKFIFQSEEEVPSGGALPLCEAGVMENPHVDAIVALHVIPDAQNTGKFGVKKGVMTSGADRFEFLVHGKGGHGSQPNTANDAILAVSQLIVMLQQVVSRNIDPLKTVVLSIGRLHGGTAENIIAGEASASGTSRFYDNEAAEDVRRHAKRIANGVAVLSGCTIDVKITPGTACVENDGELVDFAEAALEAELGPDGVIRVEDPMPFSEDFSFYQQHSDAASVMMWLYAGPEGDGVYPLHNPKCVMKTDVIKTGAAGMARIALEFLK